MTHLYIGNAPQLRLGLSTVHDLLRDVRDPVLDPVSHGHCRRAAPGLTVIMRPGETLLTRILGATAAAMVLTRWICAALVTEYACTPPPVSACRLAHAGAEQPPGPGISRDRVQHAPWSSR